MRTAAFAATLLLTLTACSTTETKVESPFESPNDLMAVEISRRIEQIPYLHREELLENLLWLGQTGEQTIPALLEALRHDNAKVRSSAAWVLGRIGDRRTIPQLRTAAKDREETVRLESARTLVLLGDLDQAPSLIEGLDSDRKEVRYLCHEALKTATGHDFGYDHLAVNQTEVRGAVLKWRQWWSEYSGDQRFTASYQQRYGLMPNGSAAQPASPAGEVQPRPMGDANMAPNSMPQGSMTPNSMPQNSMTPNSMPQNSMPQNGTETGMPGNQTPGNAGSQATPRRAVPIIPVPSEQANEQATGQPNEQHEGQAMPPAGERPAPNEMPVPVPVLEIENPAPKNGAAGQAQPHGNGGN
ncbi:MAG: HEAT repeat domain-containing protein [Planctomycetes bacterium]|nr:HEAT repeat domain-containing protein [Planctomycetota bacterium]